MKERTPKTSKTNSQSSTSAKNSSEQAFFEKSPSNPFFKTNPSNKGSSTLQMKETGSSNKADASAPKSKNDTGLPDNLKTGVEKLSGYSMDDVKVHRNSDKPAELQAHAYAKGTDIHLGPGQEKHLPHEAWHVVQQKQGRVKPTMQLKGKLNVNDDAGLEKEADMMGEKALQNHSLRANSQNQTGRNVNASSPSSNSPAQSEVIQRHAELQSLSNEILNSNQDLAKLIRIYNAKRNTPGSLVLKQVLEEIILYAQDNNMEALEAEATRIHEIVEFEYERRLLERTEGEQEFDPKTKTEKAKELAENAVGFVSDVGSTASAVDTSTKEFANNSSVMKTIKTFIDNLKEGVFDSEKDGEKVESGLSAFGIISGVISAIFAVRAYLKREREYKAFKEAAIEETEEMARRVVEPSRTFRLGASEEESVLQYAKRKVFRSLGLAVVKAVSSILSVIGKILAFASAGTASLIAGIIETGKAITDISTSVFQRAKGLYKIIRRRRGENRKEAAQKIYQGAMEGDPVAYKLIKDLKIAKAEIRGRNSAQFGEFLFHLDEKSSSKIKKALFEAMSSK